MKNSAIIVVDMQYDFIDGSLACQGADDAVRAVAAYLRKATDVEDLDENGIADTLPVMFTRDAHPADHCSFAANGGTWPVHCVEGTHGAMIHKDLMPYVSEEMVFCKGCSADCEQYSGHDGLNGAGQSMGEILDLMEISDVFVCGIATEFCVRNTAEDLLKAGFRVHLMKDMLAWVDRKGHEKALKEMSAEGIHVE